MNFAESIERIPFNASTDNGRGFIGPLIRLSGHLLYILGNLHNTPSRRPTDAQIRTEMDAMLRHFEGFNVPNYLSTAAKTRLDQYIESVNLMNTEIETWDHDTRVANVRALSNRTAEIAVFLDKEILGITDSDAGQDI